MLDDNRLYRRTDPPLPPAPVAKPKANSKKGKAAARAKKRRRVAEPEDSADGGHDEAEDGADDTEAGEDRFGGRKWECLAITLHQYQEFLESMRKSKDSDERYLHKRLTQEVLPVIEKAEEEQQKKIARKRKELLNLEKLATAKRSSRIASKIDKEREEQEALDAERRRRAALIEGRKEEERQKRMEEARESRMMTREQRLKEREYKRLLHEEELANLSEDNKKIESGEARMSERHIKAEMEKRKKELEKLAEEDDWFFDCSVCGVHGDNLVSRHRLTSRSFSLNICRMTVLIALRVIRVTCGNTVLVLASLKPLPRKMTSTSSAETVSGARRMPRNRKFLLSSFASAHLHRHLLIQSRN